MEAIKIEETTYHETHVINSCFSYGDASVTTFTMGKIREHNERREYATLRIYTEDGARTIQLEADQMDEVSRLWQGEKESHGLSELREMYDALVAEHQSLIQSHDNLGISFGVLAEDYESKSTDLAKHYNINNQALLDENEALKKRIEQLQNVAIQAYLDIESGHAQRSYDALVAMHPDENDPYGLNEVASTTA